MASNVIKVSIISDAEAFKRGLRESEGATKSLGDKLTGLGKMAVAALAVAAANAVRKFVDDSVRAFSDLEQATGASESVFGDYADEIKSAARGAAEAVGLSESQYMQLASNLGGMLQNLGMSVGESSAKAQELIGVGADLAATYGGTVADAVGAISSLLRGERDPIERYAISVKDADIKARSLALGLDQSTTEAEKQAGAIAGLDLLYEQAARTQGQFAREADTVAGATERANAQIENNKARVGEVLVPIKQLTTELGLLGAQTLGILATGFQQLFGDLSDTDAAIQEFQIHMGVAADTAQAALTIYKEYGVSLSELIERLDLSTEELVKLRDADEDFLRSLGLTTDEIDELQALINQKLLGAQRESWIEFNRQRDAAGGVTTATEEATDALRDYSDELRAQYDPLFRVIRSQRDLKEAQEGVTAAADEFGEGSPEHIAALMEQVEATGDLQSALATLREKGITPSRGEFIKLLTQMGLNHEEAERVAEALGEIDKVTIGDKTFSIRANAPSFRWIEDERGAYKPVRTGMVALARGGVATAPTTAQIGEGGSPEGVIPFDSRGIAILAQALQMAGVGGGAGITLYVTAGMGADGNEIGRTIVEYLQRYEQSSGPIPITTRGR